MRSVSNILLAVGAIFFLCYVALRLLIGNEAHHWSFARGDGSFVDFEIKPVFLIAIGSLLILFGGAIKALGHLLNAVKGSSAGQ